jgi:hypothetical protein
MQRKPQISLDGISEKLDCFSNKSILPPFVWLCFLSRRFGYMHIPFSPLKQRNQVISWRRHQLHRIVSHIQATYYVFKQAKTLSRLHFGGASNKPFRSYLSIYGINKEKSWMSFVNVGYGIPFAQLDWKVDISICQIHFAKLQSPHPVQ